MNDVKNVLSVRRYKAGYEIRMEDVLTHFEDKPRDHSMVIKRAYTSDGQFLGDPKRAYRLCNKYGIRKFEKVDPTHCICSIGFNPEQQKWYGWSHRAIYGFGIGSEVKRGSCGYRTPSLCKLAQSFKEGKSGPRIRIDKDKKLVAVSFPYYKEIGVRENGSLIFSEEVFWDDEVYFYPGRGEWKAETLDDAKEMAKDLARGVS